MANKRSKTVDSKIKECWARLAGIAFKSALSSAEFGNMSIAEDKMGWVEAWLDNAGAEATRWRFNP